MHKTVIAWKDLVNGGARGKSGSSKSPARLSASELLNAGTRQLTDVNTALPYSNSTRLIISITMLPADETTAVDTVALETPFVFLSSSFQ